MEYAAKKSGLSMQRSVQPPQLWGQYARIIAAVMLAEKEPLVPKWVPSQVKLLQLAPSMFWTIR